MAFFLSLTLSTLNHTQPLPQQFNRADELPSQAAMKQQLSQAGKSGWTLIDLLADFHLLLFLTDLLGMDEVRCVVGFVGWLGVKETEEKGSVPHALIMDPHSSLNNNPHNHPPPLSLWSTRTFCLFR